GRGPFNPLFLEFVPSLPALFFIFPNQGLEAFRPENGIMSRKNLDIVIEMGGRPVNDSAYCTIGPGKDMAGIEVPMDEFGEIRPKRIIVQPFFITALQIFPHANFGFYKL